MTKTRGWYWKDHGEDYTRASVREVLRFKGWGTLMDLVRECENTPYKVSPVWPPDSPDAQEYRDRLVRRDQALIAALFLTGGRVSEVVPLRKNNFSLQDEPDAIIVTDMPREKSFRKIGETIENGKKKWVTEKVEVIRRDFPILKNEALVPILTSWLEETEDYLFPSPAKHRAHLTRVRAYQIVTNLGKRCGEEIWPHWFRSQRASQLAAEYGFELHALIDFFDWKDVETALTYSRLGAKKLTALMVKGQGELNENKETRETLMKKVDQLQQENEQLRAAAIQEASGW
ncbi:MAG: site-specific integrase [Candidatus Bathyarchaeota archaeon]